MSVNIKIRIAVLFALLSVLAILMLQYIWTVKLYNTKKQNVYETVSVVFTNTVDMSLLSRSNVNLWKSDIATAGINHDQRVVFIQKKTGEFITRTAETDAEFNKLNKTYYFDLAGLDIPALDSVFHESLIHIGLDIPYRIEMIDMETEKIQDIVSSNYMVSDKNKYVTEPYILGLEGKQGIRVRFENPINIILSDMKIVLAASVLLAIIMIGFIAFLISVVFYQQKISTVSGKISYTVWCTNCATPSVF